LEHSIKNTSGHFYAKQEHSRKGKECRAALDHVLTWNYHLPPQTTRTLPKSLKEIKMAEAKLAAEIEISREFIKRLLDYCIIQ